MAATPQFLLSYFLVSEPRQAHDDAREVTRVNSYQPICDCRRAPVPSRRGDICRAVSVQRSGAGASLRRGSGSRASSEDRRRLRQTALPTALAQTAVGCVRRPVKVRCFKKSSAQSAKAQVAFMWSYSTCAVFRQKASRQSKRPRTLGRLLTALGSISHQTSPSSSVFATTHKAKCAPTRWCYCAQAMVHHQPAGSSLLPQRNTDRRACPRASCGFTPC